MILSHHLALTKIRQKTQTTTNMISQAEFGNTSNTSMTISKSAMPEDSRYDGPGELEVSESQNKFAANSNKPLPKPGFSD